MTHQHDLPANVSQRPLRSRCDTLERRDPLSRSPSVHALYGRVRTSIGKAPRIGRLHRRDEIAHGSEGLCASWGKEVQRRPYEGRWPMGLYVQKQLFVFRLIVDGVQDTGAVVDGIIW